MVIPLIDLRRIQTWLASALAGFLLLSVASIQSEAAAATTNAPAHARTAAEELKAKADALAASNVVVLLRPVPLLPALANAARTNQIPLDRLDPFNPTNHLALGDALTSLVTLFEKGGRRTQWLLHLQAVPPTAKELSAKPQDPLIMYDSTGNEFKFVSSPAPVRLRFLGPYVETDPKQKPMKLENKDVRISLDEGYLSLGLDRACAAFDHFSNLKTNANGEHGSFSIGRKPASEAAAQANRKLLESVGISSNELRSVAGSIPALMSFFGLVQDTPGLDGILMKILDAPSLWSVVRHVGVNANFFFPSRPILAADSSAWGVPGHPPAYYLPFRIELNNKPALNVTLVVTDPSPPLLPSAGVIGMLAENPNDPSLYLTLRVISATRAGNTPR